MKFYEPSTYLYKNVHPAQKKLKIVIIVRIEKGMKLVLNASDPSTVTDKTYLRYTIDDDATKVAEYHQLIEEEMNWDGARHDVETYIEHGGQAVNSSDTAEPYD